MLLASTMTRAGVAHARVLFASLRRHAPGAELAVFVVDGEPGEAYGIDCDVVLTPAALGLDAPLWSRLRGSVGASELTGGLKSRVLRAALERDAHAVVLDPDVWVLAPLDGLEAELAGHDVLLMRYLWSPIDPLDEWSTVDLGPYNAALVGVRRGAEAFLDWWWERWWAAAARPAGGPRFAVQRWLASAPVLWDTGLAEDPGVGLHLYGLARRAVARDGEGWKVDGHPVRLVHATGVHDGDDAAGWFPPLPERLRPSRDPALAALWGAYVDALRAAGVDAARRVAYGWAATAQGLELDETMRRLYREAWAEEAGGDPPGPFDPDGGEAFAAWLAEPSDLRRSAARIPRYLLAHVAATPGLGGRFPDLLGPGAGVLLSWAEHASLPVPEPLRSPVLEAPPSAGPPPGPFELVPGLTVVGTAGEPAGGSAGLLVAAAGTAGVAGSTVDWAFGRREAATIDGVAPAAHDVNLLVLEPEALLAFDADYGSLVRPWRFTVAHWAAAPGDHTGAALVVVDEVWVAVPALVDELAAWTLKPVQHLPTTLAAGGEPASRPVGGALATVIDVAREADAQVAAARAALRVAQAVGTTLEVRVLGEEADPLTAERLLGWARRQEGVTVRAAPDAAAALDELVGARALLALHSPAEAPPGLPAAVAAGLPVIALAGAEEPELLAAEIPRAAGRERLDLGPAIAAATALGDPAHADRAARGAWEHAASTRSPEAIGARIAARLAALTEEGSIPLGPRGQAAADEHAEAAARAAGTA